MTATAFSPVISILDSTLRDGAQAEGISFSISDKLHIVQALDELGVSYIEAGNPSANPKEEEFFKELKKLNLQNSLIAAFGATRRKNISCKDDEALNRLLSVKTPLVVLFGKTKLSQVTGVLKTSLKENLSMIEESCDYCAKQNRLVVFDAEHFFDGFFENKEYVFKCLHAAVSGGAQIITLCDTNGGTLPLDIYNIVKSVVTEFAGVTGRKGNPVTIGFHAHNDCGLAVSNSLMAVEAGATHIQGTILGYGERTGNANLSTIIPNLELKMGLTCLPQAHLQLLTPICRQIAQVSNINLNDGLPYVGDNAFSHKAGMHSDAVAKNHSAYEHITPQAVGNDRHFLLSDIAGRSLVLELIKKYYPNYSKQDAVVKEIIKKIKELESQGYQFEGAEASFELLVHKIAGSYKPFFKLHYYKTDGELPKIDTNLSSFSQLKIEVDGKVAVTAGDGDGPVHALDVALRRALEKFYPQVKDVRLTDYKVRVLDGHDATASKVRVLIESSDGKDNWTTVGVSSDIIEASWLALVDSIEFKLMKSFEKNIIKHKGNK